MSPDDRVRPWIVHDVHSLAWDRRQIVPRIVLVPGWRVLVVRVVRRPACTHRSLVVVPRGAKA